MRFAKDLLNKGAGFDLIAVSKEVFTIRLRSNGLSKVKPLATSAGKSSRGTMSNNNTSTPILAKWQAIRDPITPDPNTATFLIFLFISCVFLFYYCLRYFFLWRIV